MAHLTNFSFEFFYEIFTEDASLLCLYHGAKKSKTTKNSSQGGSCLKILFFSIVTLGHIASTTREPLCLVHHVHTLPLAIAIAMDDQLQDPARASTAAVLL